MGTWSGLLLEESRTLAGELMVAFGFLYMVVDYTSVRTTEDFEEVQVQSRGFGILNAGYRSQELLGLRKIFFSGSSSFVSWILLEGERLCCKSKALLRYLSAGFC
ncbi:uncharacterized protein [Primulina eburnea]|uniref:uncharacterized protein isoform X4 n=1 Tax=Primulina eburnea TaxID=1245227 RepID=UPI003C6C0BE5